MSASSLAAGPARPRQLLSGKQRRTLDTVLTFLALGAVSLIMLMPLYLMLLISTRPADKAFTYPPDLWFTYFTLDNYPEALFRLLPFSLYVKNTVIIATAVIVGEILSCSLVAYGFARFRFPGRDTLFIILLATLLMPFVVRLVPLFILFQKLGWINTFLPLIVPSFFGTPFFIFLMRQFFLTIPPELVDAARIDGAGELHIWWRIMLPLSKPALAAVAIFAFQNTWNDFLGPLVFLQRADVRTIILGLYGLMGMFVEWHLVMAAVVAAVTPLILVFFIFQRFFVQGITVSGLKG
ncbi:MAG: carbohydrate ABC transporter permease [Chloroflexi bacterium]|nr:carbohydrate ABC transporter permease [Chloroflexota bacterium]